MDELRRMPHNLEAEQAIIGSMLIDPRCVPEVIELLNQEDFYLPAHKDIFDSVQAVFLSGKPFDYVVLLADMRARGVFDEQNSGAYLRKLVESTPTSAHVSHYAALIKDSAVLRKICEISAELQTEASQIGADASAVLDHAEQLIYNIRSGRQNTGFHKIGGILAKVYQNIKALVDAGGRMPGIPTGIIELDDILGGLIDSNFVLFASRPGMGKTSIALNIALHAVRSSGKSAAFFSLEMSCEQLVTRLLSSEARVDSRDIQRGMINTSDWKRIAPAAASLSKTEMLFDDNSAITVNEMKAKCRRVKNLGLIVIDYLQLMQGSSPSGKRYDNRAAEVGEISRSLKIMAKELNVPVLCLAQLNRESTKHKRPMLSDLRESGSIEQDADSVVFISRGDPNDPEVNPNEAELIIAKNRHGRTGEITVLWEGQFTSFSSIAPGDLP